MTRGTVFFALIAAIIGFVNYNTPAHVLIDLNDMKYDVTPLKAPVLTGALLQAFVLALETWPISSIVIPLIKQESNFGCVNQLANSLPDTVPRFTPSVYPSPALYSYAAEAASHPQNKKALLEDNVTAGGQPDGFHMSVRDYADAFRKGQMTPLSAAKQLLKNIKASNALVPPLLAFTHVNETDVLAQAAASTARFKANKPLSVLDGVPVGVKDEMDVKGYVTTVGTAYINDKSVATEDCTAVANLRKLGAVIAGKTNMHEIGAGITGYNLRGSARNPYNTSHHTGGSSSGSAAAVAAGLVPLAIGADGGGSVRIPASLCGVVGLKGTYGRVSEHGAFPLAWTIGHIGPFANNVYDLAVGYLAIAGPDLKDSMTEFQPPAHAALLSSIQDLKGLKIGVFQDWNNDASPAITVATQAAVAGLKKRGATVVEVAVNSLNAIFKAHSLTILSEMASSIDRFYHTNTQHMGSDIRANLAIARSFTSRDYVQAQKVRAYCMQQLEQIFQRVDLLVSPTTGMTAPYFSPASVAQGESNLDYVSRVMKFALLGNFAGNPAISVPAGYDSAGLPIGVQLMGRHWEEHVVLRGAAAVESVMEKKRRPAVFYDMFLKVNHDGLQG